MAQGVIPTESLDHVAAEHTHEQRLWQQGQQVRKGCISNQGIEVRLNVRRHLGNVELIAVDVREGEGRALGTAHGINVGHMHRRDDRMRDAGSIVGRRLWQIAVNLRHNGLDDARGVILDGIAQQLQRGYVRRAHMPQHRHPSLGIEPHTLAAIVATHHLAGHPTPVNPPGDVALDGGDAPVAHIIEIEGTQRRGHDLQQRMVLVLGRMLVP